MRKILLASTAIAGIAMFAPMAQAQTKDSPLNVNLGGYVDFRAGHFTSSTDIDAAPARKHDFETEYKLNIDVDGKAMRGVEYGGRLSLWNGSTYTDAGAGNGNIVRTADAYVYLAGAYGKVIGGDHNGASDLFVYAPTVGLGQVDGKYTDFLDPTEVTAFMPSFIENGVDFSTKVTYMTPKVGNDNHKVQLAVSYAPNFFDAGQRVYKYSNGTTPPGVTPANPLYRNMVKGAAQYQGTFSPVGWVLSADVISANGEQSPVAGAALNSFTSWGIGTQLTYGGFTAGGSYVDAGSFFTVNGQSKLQRNWSAGLKYEMDKVAVAASYLNGKGYNNFFNTAGVAASGKELNYVNNFNSYGVGGVYTWFPGMATQADVVHFYQERADGTNVKNAGEVFVISQKLTF